MNIINILIAAVAAFAATLSHAAAMGTAFRVAYSFRNGGDGGTPMAGLVMDKAGLLYGTSQTGGLGYGTLFRFDPARETLTVLHRFTANEGSFAGGSLALSNGMGGRLYGTLAGGGEAGCGAVYTLDTNSTAYRTLYSFTCGLDGGKPVSGVVIDKDGTLYGETTVGGAGGVNTAGTIFSVKPMSGAMAVLHSFINADRGDGAGGNPLLALDGAIYGGTCVFDSNPGYVFKLSPTTGALQIVHQFAGNDGYCPNAVSAGPAGVLYGTSRYGGTEGPAGGVVFKLDPVSGTQSVLHDFNLSQGLPPLGVTIAQNGDLLGARAKGFFSLQGSTFKLNAATGAYRTLDNVRAIRTFRETDPNPGLVVDGTAVYGTTAAGGSAGKGSIFEIIQ